MQTEELAPMNITGEFYHALKAKNNYDRDSMELMESTVKDLRDIATTSNKPGMLLGKIQSGKTRAFIGIMALAYDNGYDLVIILTKNSNALAKQTYERLEAEFESLIDDEAMQVYDIMSIPDNLRNYELKKKLAIVLKKEKRNIERLEKALFDTYPSLSERKVLFIDDEADFASVAYDNNKKENIVELKVIASQIDQLRAKLTDTSYLQVTATPYSLYLQPDKMEVNEYKVYQPKRPAFTQLVPVHDKYIGGETYFEKSKISGHMASCLFHEINEDELEILKKSDRRRVKSTTILTARGIEGLRTALVNFIVGGCIRRLQNAKEEKREEKYAFIIHTITSKAAHQWQDEIMMEMENKLVEAMENEEMIFKELLITAYEDLRRSRMKNEYFPTFEAVYHKVCDSLKDEELLISVVNSEKDVNQLLDKTGQLKLRTPLNIFIGGQILDRGITIGNLIGFYYGRNPQKFQQDTVLQHSRMYGARPLEDVAVTRFYTTRRIYQVMEQMHEFDTELRATFEKGANHNGVVFIQRDLEQQIIPCSPNKIMLSSINMIKPHKRFLPVGFEPLNKTKMKPKMAVIDEFIDRLYARASEINPEDPNCFTADLEEALQVIEKIHDTLVMDTGYTWDLEEYETLINYLSKETTGIYNGKVWLIVRKDRHISRIRKSTGKLEDSPDTSSGQMNELKIAKKVATDCPALILLRQSGTITGEYGWKHQTPFYWPVLVAPKNTAPTVFANKAMK